MSNCRLPWGQIIFLQMHMHEIAVGFKGLCMPKLCNKCTCNSVMCSGHCVSGGTWKHWTEFREEQQRDHRAQGN